MQAPEALHHVTSSRRIGHGSKPLYGHSLGATETLVINPKAGLQTRHVAYAAAATAGNMTYHSNSSGTAPLLRKQPLEYRLQDCTKCVGNS